VGVGFGRRPFGKFSMCKRRWGLTETQQKAIMRWAEKNTRVRELRVFGSRAKGNARIDSDLDIA
jgi:predicted nucleotidyltransferase